jgi:hypothetical protein
MPCGTGSDSETAELLGESRTRQEAVGAQAKSIESMLQRLR